MELWIALILFAIGGVLVALELFLPGGVLGTCGAVALLAGVVVCFFHSQAAGAIAVVSVAVIGPLVGWFWVSNAHRLPGARSLFLADTAGGMGTPAYLLRPGQTGVAVSELRPGGTCEFDGERVPCLSESGIIQAGTEVRVVAFADGRATVRPA